MDQDLHEPRACARRTPWRTPWLLLMLTVPTSVAWAHGSGAHAPPQRTQAWLCWESSGKGARTRPIDRARPLAYFTKHLADFDREIARRAAHETTRSWSAIRADVNFVGRVAGQSVLDVFYALPDNQRPFGKMILVGSAGHFRPLVWILDDSDLQPQASELTRVRGLSILSTRCRETGTGRLHVEDYFVLGPHAPLPWNVRPALEAAIDAEQQRLLPAGCRVSKDAGFDLAALKYVTAAWKPDDAKCCPSCGRLEITFEVADGRIREHEAHYDPKFKWQ